MEDGELREEPGGPQREELLVAPPIASADEIDLRRREIEHLAAYGDHLRLLFDEAPVGIALTDLTQVPRRWIDLNDALAQMLGYSREELLDINPDEVMHPEDRSHPEIRQMLDGSLRRFDTQRRFVHKDGRDVWARASVNVLESAGSPTLAVTYFMDVTERVLAERALARSEFEFRSAFDQAPIGMAMFSLDPATAGRFMAVNPAYCRLVGVPAERLLEMDVRQVTYPDDVHIDEEWLASAISDGTAPIQFEKRFRHADGHTIWVRVRVSVVRDADGRPLHTINQVEDVTSLRKTQERLEHQALHDLLTGLPNRALLMDRLRHALAEIARSRKTVAVLFVDLDRFKSVNDNFGHAVGDRFLVEVGRRLAGVVRSPDTVARFGGDEFVVVCTNIHGRSDAEVIASRVIEEIATPFSIEGREATISASVGIALTHRAEDEPDELLRRADAAMFDAKQSGRSRYQLCTEAFGGAGSGLASADQRGPGARLPS